MKKKKKTNQPTNQTSKLNKKENFIHTDNSMVITKEKRKWEEMDEDKGEVNGYERRLDFG